MSIYVFTIRRDELSSPSGEVKNIFEKDLLTVFPSYDYMCGYAKGYGSDKIKIYTMTDYQKEFNSVSSHNHYIYFVSVKDYE